MKVVFRVDSSSQIGSGHIIRCLTLARSLSNKGAECHFVCRSFPGNFSYLIKNQGYQLSELPSNEKLSQEDDTKIVNQLKHALWLGADANSDAEQTIKAIGDSEIDLLVVDHYAIDEIWESKLRGITKEILVIDDLADRNHDCDYLLDQNLTNGYLFRYENLIPDHSMRLIGPDFALLQPEYKEYAKQAPNRKGLAKRILVYFGEADTQNFTGRVIDSFLSLQIDNVELDVVLNKKSKHFKTVKEQSIKYDQVKLHDHMPSLAAIMLKADVAIGGSGATSWERCCLGLPSIVITMAENQRPIAEELNRLGYIKYLGHFDSLDQSKITTELNEMITSEIPNDLSSHCQMLVDGKGASRVASILMLDEKQPMIFIRRAALEDKTKLIKWVKSDDRSNNENHDIEEWLNFCFRNPDRHKLFITEGNSNLDLGLVHFEKKETQWITNYFLEKYTSKIKEKIIQSAILAFRKQHKGPIKFEQFGQGLSLSICSDSNSWINEFIPDLIRNWQGDGHSVSWVHESSDLDHGDICFYLSYGKIVDSQTRSKYSNNLVVHASDLPKGRGWSPSSWLILEGQDELPITLLEAEDEVDSGFIYGQELQQLDGIELVDDWRALLAEKTKKLASSFVSNFPTSLDRAIEQLGEPTYYKRRRPDDSALDINKSLAEQINNLRIADNDNYPAYFIYKGKKFILKIYSG